MVGKMIASKVGNIFNLLLLYMMKRILNKDQLLLAAMFMFVDKNKTLEDLYISATAEDICWDLTEGTNSVHNNSLYPPVNSIGKEYADVSLFDIIKHMFSDPKHLPDPLLSLPTSPDDETICRKELLENMLQDVISIIN